MGACCSGSTVDTNGDIKTVDSHQLKKKLTAHQLALIIKVQANIRGFLTRKKIREMQINAGMGMDGFGYNADGELQQDYDNPKVQVRIGTPKLVTSLLRSSSRQEGHSLSPSSSL